MPRMLVRTTAQATVDEEWLIEVTDQQAEALLLEPWTFEDLVVLDEVEVIKVDNVDIRNEEDRTVTHVERALRPDQL